MSQYGSTLLQTILIGSTLYLQINWWLVRIVYIVKFLIIPGLRESEVRNLLNRLEANTRNFQKSVDRSLDNSRLNDSNREDKINDYLKDFRKSTTRLRDRYSRNDTLSREDVREVLDRAAKIDNLLSRGRGRNIYRNNNRNNNKNNNGNLRQQCQDIRADLDILARISYGRSSNYNRR